MSVAGSFNEYASKKYSEAVQFSILYKTVHPFTVFHYLGDLSGKSILDVGCGNGRYSRQLKSKGAAKIVGIDWSKSMIDIARKMEEENPLGCQYYIGDVTSEEVIGQFDIVVAILILHFADSYDHLKKFCSFLQRNLKPGGICLAMIINCLSDKFWDDSLIKYGYRHTFLNALPEGGYRFKGKLLTSKKDEFLEVTAFCLPPEMYEKCFKEVGFKSFQFKKCLHDSEFPDEFWKDYDENQSEVVILAEN